MDRPNSSAGEALERGYRFEQTGVVARALDMYREALDASTTGVERAEAKLRIARVLRSMSLWDESIAASREAVGLASAAKLDDLAAEAMNVEIGVYLMRGDFAAAESLAEEALDLARSPRIRGMVLGNMGAVAARRREFEKADDLFGQAIAAYREVDYAVGVVVALNNRAQAALDRGRPEEALQFGTESATAARVIGALTQLIIAVESQASALIALGDFDKAETLLTEALGHFTTARDPIRQAECLELMGQVSERRQPPDYDMAKRFYSRAQTLARDAGERLMCDRLEERTRKITQG